MAKDLLTCALGLVQAVLIVAAAPLLTGLLRWIKARLQGYEGPSLLQPYRDLRKLLRTPAVWPEDASIVFKSAPYVLFAAYGAIACAVPLFSARTLLAGDLLQIIYIFALGRFVFSLAGLDTGSSFGGLGSSREMFLHLFTEAGLAVVLVGLAVKWRSTALEAILWEHWALGLGQFAASPDLVLLAFAFGLIMLFEVGRIPIDNPATHLELTMTHRAIALEYAGRDLAIVEWAEHLKLAVLFALLANLFLPFPSNISIFGAGAGALLGSLGLTIVRTAALTLLLALWELTQPKLRLRAVTGLALVAVILGLIAILYGITLGSQKVA